MTNAKSRLVRIIALALAVLMVVPMALVGCKKTDAGVDQAAIDAAIKEALDAAQKAQDAADKAAQDAKDAQDKLAAAEKEAADLQGQIDAMKNTTTVVAPATTTQAPVAEDAKIVDAYIADMLYGNESEYVKLAALYTEMAKAYLGNDTAAADAKAIAYAIETARVAIQRAPSTDYVNSIVATLAADLDAIPTISERVKAAYDAIDFTADNDIVDVAYANALLAEADKILAAASSSMKEVTEFIEAEKKAIKAYGEEKLDLATLIADEYARYAENDGIYADAFGFEKADELVAAIKALFGADNDKLEVEKIVYGTAANEDAVEAIEDLYDEFYKEYKKDFAEYQDALEIAVIGKGYLLKAEGNFLKEKLAAAKARVAELEAAVEEFKATKEFKNIYTLVDAEGLIYNAKYNAKIVAAAEALAAWMAKYGFDAEDDNLGAIINREGKDDYASFVVINATMNLVNEWAAKLDAIDASDIDAAMDAITEKNGAGVVDGYIDYAEQGAAVKALYTWYYGTYKVVKEKNDEGKLVDVIKSNEDGVINATAKVGETTVTVDAANIAAMLDKALDLTINDEKDDVKTLATELEKFEGEKLLGKKDGADAIVATINAIKKDANKLDLAALKAADFEGEGAVATLIGRIEALCDEFGVKADEDGVYNKGDKNYGVIPFDVLETLETAKEALMGDLLAKAAEIVKAYIGWTGEYIEDDDIVVFEKAYLYDEDKDAYVETANVKFDVDAVEISAFSYELISKLAADYNAIKAFDLDQEIFVENEDEVKAKFTTAQVVEFYRAMNDEFYYNIMEKIHGVAYDKVSQSTAVGTVINSLNEWMNYGATATDTLKANVALYGQYGLKYVYPENSSAKKGTGNDINVYKTVAGVGDKDKTYIKAIEDVDAHKYAIKNADGLTIGFDAAAYKAAVDANIAAYRTAWYTKYLANKDNKDTITGVYVSVIENVIAYGLWTIEGEFEMNDEAYTFVVNADKTVTVYDDADEVATEVEAEDGTKYTLKAEIVDNKVVIKAGAKALAEVDDDTTTDAPKYEYVLADGVAEIVASSKAIGNVKKATHSSYTYAVYSEKNLNTIIDAFVTNQFYVNRDDKVAEAKKYLKKENNEYIYPSEIVNLAREFEGVWKDVKHDKVTLAEIEEAYEAFTKQVAKFSAAE